MKCLGCDKNVDAFLTEYLPNLVRGVWIFPPGELRSNLDDRHPAAEATIGLCQLETDIPTAERGSY